MGQQHLVRDLVGKRKRTCCATCESARAKVKAHSSPIAVPTVLAATVQAAVDSFAASRRR